MEIKKEKKKRQRVFFFCSTLFNFAEKLKKL